MMYIAKPTVDPQDVLYIESANADTAYTYAQKTFGRNVLFTIREAQTHEAGLAKLLGWVRYANTGIEETPFRGAK